MSKSYSATLSIPFVLLGLPLESSENPFLVVPSTCKARIAIEIAESGGIGVRAPCSSMSNLLKKYVENIVNELQLDLGVEADVSVLCESYSFSGLYAASSSAILYYIAKYFGEALGSASILEYSRMLDPLDQLSGWTAVIDALRFSSLTGKAVVYRNDEEYGELLETEVEARIEKRVGSRQRWSVEDLGSDLYGAFIHAVGVMVLEGAVRLRESNGFKRDVMEPLLEAHNTVARFFWNISPEGLHLSPGLPGVFEIVKI